MVVEPNVGLEITKGVGKVVVQELHGILELVVVVVLGVMLNIKKNVSGQDGIFGGGVVVLLLIIN